jgi:hypothetical protein
VGGWWAKARPAACRPVEAPAGSIQGACHADGVRQGARVMRLPEHVRASRYALRAGAAGLATLPCRGMVKVTRSWHACSRQAECYAVLPSSRILEQARSIIGADALNLPSHFDPARIENIYELDSESNQTNSTMARYR